MKIVLGTLWIVLCSLSLGAAAQASSNEGEFTVEELAEIESQFDFSSLTYQIEVRTLYEIMARVEAAIIQKKQAQGTLTSEQLKTLGGSLLTFGAASNTLSNIKLKRFVKLSNFFTLAAAAFTADAAAKTYDANEEVGRSHLDLLIVLERLIYQAEEIHETAKDLNATRAKRGLAPIEVSETIEIDAEILRDLSMDRDYAELLRNTLAGEGLDAEDEP